MSSSKKKDNGGIEPADETLSTQRLSVRDLASYAYRHGGLGKASSFTETDDNPNRLHQQYIKASMKRNPEMEHYPEYYLKTDHEISPVRFEVQGRADLISVSSNGDIAVLEIKTIIDSKGVLPDKADIVHYAQARIYGYIFCMKTDSFQSGISVTIRYVLAPDHRIRDFTEHVDFEFLKTFFTESCLRLLEFTRSLNSYRKLRDITLKNLKFPYPSLRKGQKEFMNEVLASIKSKEPLYTQAPTGIGKTISVLFPAVKSIPRNFADYIFYLTAKTSTQSVAESALDDLRKAGMVLKSIRITSKEKICPCKEIYCDTDICRFAMNYYDNSTAAIRDLFMHDSIDAQVLTAIALKHNVCPFEIGLDISLFCDVIICDYNYVFDPKVMLVRFILEESYRFVFLIDEAHNLPSRSNEMYSASFGRADYEELLRYEAHLPLSLRRALDAIVQYFKKAQLFLGAAPQENGLKAGTSEAEDSFDGKIGSKDLIRVEGVCATRNIPAELIGLMENFVAEAKPELDAKRNKEIHKVLIDAFFAVKFFIKVAAEFFNENYVVMLSAENGSIQLRLKCMNASERLSAFHNGKNATVYFSATMSPEEYYTALFKGKSVDYNLRKKIFGSPFPSENLWVGAVTSISTRYEARQYTLGSVAEMIYSAISVRNGNYLVFCPSFEYQRLIYRVFTDMVDSRRHDARRPVRTIVQKRVMNESERSAFLDSFVHNRIDTLVGFAVLGGVFGEGIDLTGESLSGVVLIGVGLPAKSFEQDILMDYFNNAMGNGFDYAYKFPGFNKILQAAGRVIRTETDRGFILLIDERYGRDDYKMLFPDEWKPLPIDTAKDLKKELMEFFGETDFSRTTP
ncbi:MAG: ATP-dependent DNA helicase [Saccharofermentanales bacterium]